MRKNRGSSSREPCQHSSCLRGITELTLTLESGELANEEESEGEEMVKEDSVSFEPREHDHVIGEL